MAKEGDRRPRVDFSLPNQLARHLQHNRRNIPPRKGILLMQKGIPIPTLDHLARSFAILPSYAVPVLQHMPGWWRAHPGRSCFLARPIRDRRSSRAHVLTNAARARTCRGGVVSASISSIRRIQFSKGNRRRPLWAESVLRRRVGTPPVRPFTAVRPTGALRPTEASKHAIGYVPFTSTPAGRIAQIPAIHLGLANGSTRPFAALPD